MNENDLAKIAAALRERQATVHERVACPRCGAPQRRRCVRVNVWGYSPGARPLKHPHRERLRADGIYER